MSRPEPLTFGSDDRPLFGWLHRSVRRSRLGLVVCNPFGYEAICAHRGLRAFAEAAAAAGFPALRFDYDGTGDSAGDDREPERLRAWIGSVHHAVVTLRRVAGVEQVALLGLRLGALVATLAATERDDIDSLIAVAPVVAGKAYVRELRALQNTLALASPPAGTAPEAGVQESLGFPFTAATKNDLTQIDLACVAPRPAPAVLLIDREDLPGNDAWPTQLERLGVDVTRKRLPGYVELVLGAEHSIVPEAMVRVVVDWLVMRGAHLAAKSLPPSTDPATGEPPVARARLGGVVETPHFIDETGRLFGILSNPAVTPSARRALLLLNAGAVHHIGPNRLYVTLARRWAAMGHAVLRLDVSGIGDSRARPGERENVVYGDGALEDVRRAVAFLRRQPGVVDVHALGLCSGGYHAFKAAVAGAPVDGVTLINPLTFFFKPEEHTDKGEAAVTGEAARYLRRLRDPEAWKKLLRSGVDLRVPVQTLTRFAATRLRARIEEVARRAGLKVGDDLAGELRTLAGRRIPLRFVFSSGDPGLDLLRVHGGPTVDDLQRARQLAIQVIDGPDHTFTPLWSHPALIAVLAAHLDELAEPSR